MHYDPKEFQCIGDDMSLLVYQSKNYYGETKNNKLIWAFKDNDDDTVQWVTEVIIQLLAQHEMAFQDQLRCHYIVSIPRCRAGCANIPCERVCAALTQRFTWLTHLPNALVRTQTVPKSAM